MFEQSQTSSARSTNPEMSRSPNATLQGAETAPIAHGLYDETVMAADSTVDRVMLPDENKPHDPVLEQMLQNIRARELALQRMREGSFRPALKGIKLSRAAKPTVKVTPEQQREIKS